MLMARKTTLRGCALTTQFNPHYDRYKLALISRSTKRVFAENTAGDIRLPLISIPRWTRFAEQVQAEIEHRWGFKTVLLDRFGDCPGGDHVVAAEVIGADRPDEWQGRFGWTAFAKIQAHDIPDPDRAAIDKLLTLGATGRGPFSRLRWTDQLLDWIAEETDLDHSHLSREFQHLNGTANDSLIRIHRRNASALWFKAVGEANLREFQSTKMLSRYFPAYLPTILAICEDCNGWLMEDAGKSFDVVGSMYGHSLEQVGDTLAAIQSTSIAHVDAMIAEGFRDQRIPILRSEMAELMPIFEQAVLAQTSEYPPRLKLKRVYELETIFLDACCCLEGLDIPAALVHNDINLDDILLKRGSCVLTDWTGAAVGDPFVTLELLKMQLAQLPHTAKWIPRLAAAYRKRWRVTIPEEHIEQAISLAPLIAFASQFCSRKEALISEQLPSPGLQSYIRSSLRHMDHAARSPELLRTLSA